MIAQNTRILWLPGDDSRNWDYETGGWASSNRNPSGVKVDAETALRSTVVLSCMRVLSTSVAGLPLHIYRRLRDGGKEIAREHPLYRILHTKPNGWQTSVEWREQLMLHMLSHGQAFNEKVYSGGQISEIIPLHPSRMKLEQLENNRLRYSYREDKGSSTVYTQDAIMHIRGMSDDGVNGMSMVELARDAIGLARACEIHGATFFGNGARPGVILSTDQMLSPEAAENTRNQWERAHRGPDRSNRTAVLQGGLKVSELGGNNQESQFLEARRFQVEEICRIFGVPPHLAGDLSRSSFSNIEQQSLDYLQNGLMPWLRRIESAIARDLLEGDDEYFAEFDTRGVLRADAAGRAAYYNTLWNLGVASVNEIRSWENMNPVEGGDTRFVQLNMTTLDKAAQAAEEPEVVEEVVTVEEPAAPPADAPTVIEVLDQYRTGSLTLEGAKALMMVSFPQTPEAMIDAILAGVVVKEPEPEPAPAAAGEEPAAQPVEPAAEEAASRAAPGTLSEGDFVSWGSAGGRARGRIDHVMDYGTLDVPDTDFKIDATEDDPAALITVYEEVSGGWRPTETQVGHKVSTLTKIDPLPEPPPVEEKGYAKKKRKPARRDCGTGAGGFKPGNKCGGEGGGGSSGGADSSASAGSDAVGSGGGGANAPAHVEGSNAHAAREANRNARRTKDYPPANPQGDDTMSRHTGPDGDFTPERKVMHEQIVSDATAGVPKSAEPTLYMMGGGPAAGKSSIIKNGDVTHPDQHVLANPDEFKADIPEYRDGLASGDAKAAAFAHEESSYLNKRVMQTAASNEQDVVWDGTGDNSIQKLEQQVKVFREKGYKVQADYVTCDTDTAVSRSNARGEKTGRVVPEEAIRETHARVSEIWPEAVSRGLFDRSDLYDTTSGGKPILIASARGTSLEVKDEAAYKRFLDKAKRGRRSRRKAR